MTPKQKAMIVEALTLAADKAQNAMLHAQTALIDLKYDDPQAAAWRANHIAQETSEAQQAATKASAWLTYICQPGEDS